VICYIIITGRGETHEGKTKTIPIEQVVAMMYAVLSPYVEPTDSLAKILIQRVLAKYGYKLE
jgi:hypothetical protein